MAIAILGWGSLLWDKQPGFDDTHKGWNFDGPNLPLEFSRISAKTRAGALTLVIDQVNGKLCTVAYAISRRKALDDAVCDLRCREGTELKNIGVYTPKTTDYSEHFKAIQIWAEEKEIEGVVWANLSSNFEKRQRTAFSVEKAISYIQTLQPVGKAKAAEYVWCAPKFIDTPLRRALQSHPWFAEVPTEHPDRVI